MCLVRVRTFISLSMCIWWKSTIVLVITKLGLIHNTKPYRQSNADITRFFSCFCFYLYVFCLFCLFIYTKTRGFGVSHWSELCYCFDTPANCVLFLLQSWTRNECVLWAVYQISTINANWYGTITVYNYVSFIMVFYNRI